jgi:hypothetical protein
VLLFFYSHQIRNVLSYNWIYLDYKHYFQVHFGASIAIINYLLLKLCNHSILFPEKKSENGIKQKLLTYFYLFLGFLLFMLEKIKAFPKINRKMKTLIALFELIASLLLLLFSYVQQVCDSYIKIKE